jgi:hypothetical protein
MSSYGISITYAPSPTYIQIYTSKYMYVSVNIYGYISMFSYGNSITYAPSPRCINIWTNI